MNSWTEIQYDGMSILAMDFLNGVIARAPGEFGTVFIPGYQIVEQRGDMDGPALRPRRYAPKEFALKMVEAR